MSGAEGSTRGSEDSAVIAAQVLELLAGRGETLAVAESLTGGLVAAGITAVPGASRVFRGSITAYATVLKRDLLGVDGALLDEQGPVDPEVARQMARGVRTSLGAGWGVATTGVAGPGSQDGQPAGTVFTAVAGPGGGSAVARFHFDGDRATVRSASVGGVLTLLLREAEANERAQDTEQPGGF